MGFDFVSLFGMKEGSVNNGAGKRRELLEEQQQQNLEKGEGMAPEAPPTAGWRVPALVMWCPGSWRPWSSEYTRVWKEVGAVLLNQFLAPPAGPCRAWEDGPFSCLTTYSIHVYCKLWALFPELYRIPLQLVYFLHSRLYLLFPSPYASPQMGHPKFSESLVLLLFSLVCCIVYIPYLSAVIEYWSFSG